MINYEMSQTMEINAFNAVETPAMLVESVLYGTPVVHAMATTQLLCNLTAKAMPSSNFVPLKQHFEFLLPIYYKDQLSAKVEVKHLRDNKAFIHTYLYNQHDRLVVKGVLQVLFTSL